MLSSEQALLQRHCEGDSDAFAELVELYRRPVYAYLARCGIAADARDDIAQEVFFKLHKAAASYAPDRPLRAFVFTVLANTARSYFRKRTVWSRIFSREEVPDEVDTKSARGDAVAQARQTAAWLDNAVRDLPEVQREVVLLRVTGELEMQEIADILNIPIGTVKTHLRRARVALAKKLARRGHAEEP